MNNSRHNASKFVVIQFAIIIALVSSCTSQVPDYQNSKLHVEKRISDLLDRMTLEEKCYQVVGKSIDHNQESLQANERLGIPPFVIVG